MVNEYQSYIDEHPRQRLVYSSLGFYGQRPERRLPGRWFVRALGDLGVPEAAVRQTLYRMEQDGLLSSIRVGRNKLYAGSEYAWTAIRSTRQRLSVRPPRQWDGRWTIVHTRFGADDRVARDRSAHLLRIEGFASLAPGLYVHPGVRVSRLCHTLGSAGLLPHATMFRGSLEQRDPHELVKSLWDFDTIAARHAQFLRRYEPVLERGVDALTGHEAFIIKYAVVLDYLQAGWEDSEIPAKLLPDDWSGHRAREVATVLNRELLAPAIDHAETLMKQVLDERLAAALAA